MKFEPFLTIKAPATTPGGSKLKTPGQRQVGFVRRLVFGGGQENVYLNKRGSQAPSGSKGKRSKQREKKIKSQIKRFLKK